MPSSGSGSASSITSGSGYADIDAWVNFLITDADAADVDFIVPQVVAELLARGDCFTTYDALSANDKIFFDTAAGYLAALRIFNRSSSSTVTGSGEIKSKTQDGLKVDYDVGTTVRTSSKAAEWQTEYENALREICPDALNSGRRARSSIPVSTLPNSADPRDSAYPSDVERVAGVV